MSVKYIRIFEDEMVAIEKVDGNKFFCFIDSSKNDLAAIEHLSSDLQDLHRITVTFTLEAKESIEIEIKDILSIERIN